MPKYKTSISIDRDTYDKVLKIAEKEKRSFSAQAEYILEKWLRDRLQQEGITP
ncbi:MAG: hypothetical protein WC749_02525 [Dehalococcoidia bacterium]